MQKGEVRAAAGGGVETPLTASLVADRCDGCGMGTARRSVGVYVGVSRETSPRSHWVCGGRRRTILDGESLHEAGVTVVRHADAVRLAHEDVAVAQRVLVDVGLQAGHDAAAVLVGRATRPSRRRSR